MAAARKPIAANTANTGQEKGAWTGGCATSGGNEKNPFGKPRHAPPASGKAASRTKAGRMTIRPLTPPIYHVAGNENGPAGNRGAGSGAVVQSGDDSDMA